jgi:glutaminyl-tRNA synthetase
MVEQGVVAGWDDPRMPTLAAYRRRGYTPEAIRECMARVGVTKQNSVTELGALEACVREHLNGIAPRRFAVLAPLKVVIENYPESEEWLEAANHPNKPELGQRKVPFSREIFIEREDFMENAPGKFHRLKPGGEVRLRYAYIIKCERVVKDSAGNVVEIRASYDPKTRSGTGPDAERKVKGTIHWVSAQHCVRAEVRLYDRLFKVPSPGQSESIESELNPESLVAIESAALEPSLGEAREQQRFQFERNGYFCVDSGRAPAGGPVFNRVVTLRDSWAKTGA